MIYCSIRNMQTLKLQVYRTMYIIEYSISNRFTPFKCMPKCTHSIHDQHAMHLVAPALFSDVSIGIQILMRKAVRNSVIYYVVINEVRHTYVIFY